MEPGMKSWLKSWGISWAESWGGSGEPPEPAVSTGHAGPNKYEKRAPLIRRKRFLRLAIAAIGR